MAWSSWLLLLASGGGEHSGGVAPLLDPHQGLVFWQVVSFCIVAIVLKKYAWGPLQTMLDEREAQIRDSLAAADKAREEAKRISAEHEDRLEDARREAEKILEEARDDARGIVDRAKAAATDEAEALKERAKHEIELAKDKAIAELREESVELGLMIASRVLKAEVDGGRHRGLVDEILASWAKN